MTRKIFIYLFRATILSISVLAGVGVLVVAKLCYRPIIARHKKQKRKKQSVELSQKYGAKNISVITDDGILLSTVLLERKNAKRTVVLCHGYRRNKERMRHFIEIFPNDNIVLFDFRAHGASSGEFTTLGHYEKCDVKAIVDFLRTHEPIQDLPIVGLGCSMGGATLLTAAGNGVNFDALIIDSSFANLHQQLAHVFTRKTGLPKVPFMLFTPHWFEYLGGSSLKNINPGEHARKITCPVLVIHSPHDTFTPVEHGHIIYKNLSGAKHIWLVDNAKHAVSAKKYPDEYKKRVDEFLQNSGI